MLIKEALLENLRLFLVLRSTCTIIYWRSSFSCQQTQEGSSQSRSRLLISSFYRLIVYRSPGGQVFLVILMLVGFIALDIVYAAIVINYATYCELLILMLRGMSSRVLQKTTTLQDVMRVRWVFLHDNHWNRFLILSLSKEFLRPDILSKIMQILFLRSLFRRVRLYM